MNTPQSINRFMQYLVDEEMVVEMMDGDGEELNGVKAIVRTHTLPNKPTRFYTLESNHILAFAVRSGYKTEKEAPLFPLEPLADENPTQFRIIFGRNAQGQDVYSDLFYMYKGDLMINFFNMNMHMDGGARSYRAKTATAKTRCTKQTTRKYLTRASPPYAANQCPAGSVRKGNDGKMYRSTVASNGVHRWMPVAKRDR
jgi:hypothetical protein